eukprot:SAG31_NODE_12387_length_945_cov_2.132388_2_plen_98_part_00
MAATSPYLLLPFLGLTAANECGIYHFFHCVQCACCAQPVELLLKLLLKPLFCCCSWSTSCAEQKQQELIGMTAAKDIDMSLFVGYADTTAPPGAQTV